MTRHELKAIKSMLPLSEATIRRNCPVGGLEANSAKLAPVQTLERREQKRPRCPSKVHCRVQLIAFRRRLLGDDAVAFACKPIRDIIAQVLLGGNLGQFDDDPIIAWEYGQQKTSGREGVIVKIEPILK